MENKEQGEQRAISSTSRRPWDKQCYLHKEKIPTVKDIIEIAEGISSERERCLFVLLYLTAGRLQEIVMYNSKKEIRSSIRKSDITIQDRDNRKILLINIRNEKNRTRHRKDLPVPLDVDENKVFYNLMVDYLNSLDDNEELFPFSYKRAYALLNKINPDWNPHWIRHIRLTHLITVYGYREHQLRLYSGWSDSRPASKYLEMKWEDLIY